VAGSRERGNDTGGRADLANSVVVEVGDVQIAAGVHGETAGIVEHRTGGRTAIAGEAGASVTGNRADDPCSVDLANPVDIEKIDVTRGIHGHFARNHGRVDSETAVAVDRIGSVAGKGGDDSGGVHFADSVVPGIANVHVARGVCGNTVGQIQQRARGGAAIA